MHYVFSMYSNCVWHTNRLLLTNTTCSTFVRIQITSICTMFKIFCSVSLEHYTIDEEIPWFQYGMQILWLDFNAIRLCTTLTPNNNQPEHCCRTKLLKIEIFQRRTKMRENPTAARFSCYNHTLTYIEWIESNWRFAI